MKVCRNFTLVLCALCIKLAPVWWNSFEFFPHTWRSGVRIHVVSQGGKSGIQSADLLKNCFRGDHIPLFLRC